MEEDPDLSQKPPGLSNAAARLRRSVSAARAAEAVSAEMQGLGSDEDDDSSLVLYRDPSRVSAQPSRGSVMSGAHEQGETFFTALRKQPSWQSDAGSDYYSQAGSTAPGSLCGGANPVQSVSHSAFFSAAGEASNDGSVLGPGEDSGRLASCGPSVESSYASALQAAAETNTDADSADVGGDGSSSGGQLTSSVLDIIDSLYGSQPRPGSQPWQLQVSAQDQPLRDMPAIVGPTAAADALMTAQPQEVGSLDVADAAPLSAQASGTDMQGQQAVACDTADPAATPACGSAGTSPGGQQVAGMLEAGGADGLASDDSSASAAGQALLAAMDGTLAERSRLQQELSGYLQQLGAREDGEGQPLVQLAEDYAVLVEQLLREGRAQQYRALQGWDGPHRFEDLPVARLRTAHKDPEVAAGLEAIAKLDEQLREASLKALVTAHALNPQQWADAEKRRLERRAADLDAALAKERQRRTHAAKLRGALNKLDEQCSAMSLGKGGPSFSYYRLQPQEEQLLAAVLSRDDAALEADNPFDPMLLNPDDTDVFSGCGGAPAGDQHVSTDASGLDAAASEHSSSWSALQSAQGSHASSTGSCSARPVSAEASEHSQGAVGGSGAETPATGAAAGAGSRGVSRVGSGLASVFSLMRPSSGARLRRCSLAEIDAQLEAMQAEREAAQQAKEGRTPDLSRSSSSKGAATPVQALSAQKSASRSASGIPACPAATVPGSATSSESPSRTCSSAGASRIPSAPVTPAATAGSSSSGGRPARVSCSGVGSAAAAHQSSLNGSSSSSSGGASSRRVSAASSGASCRSGGSSTVRTIDYIREQREVRELAHREAALDAQLRALQTSELPSSLMPQQLQALLQAAY